MRWLLALVACIILVIGGTWAYRHHAQRVSDAQTIEATRLEGERDAAIAQSKAKDLEITKRTQTIAALTDDVARAKATAAKIRAQHSIVPGVPSVPVPDGGMAGQSDDGALVASLDAVIAKQDGLIAEQKAQIAMQAERIKTGDLALQASMKQTRALELALDAQRNATQSSKWMGRFQGFAVGVAAGYLARK